MKYKTLFAYLLSIITILSTNLTAQEEDKVLIVIDRTPWKISWVEESGQWILKALFDNGELKTFFKKPPPNKGLGGSCENKPVKQEFKYYPSGSTYTSRESQFEQWPDGAKGWAFVYEDTIKVTGDQFGACTTAIIQEVGDKQDQIRYILFRATS